MANEAFGWDDDVQESSFKLIPDGDYWFEVVKFERTRYNGSDKIPACNEADYGLQIDWKDEDGEHTNTLTQRLYLVKKQQWKAYQFFESIGLVKKGSGPCKMPWDKAVGCVGICAISHHEHQGKEFNDLTPYAPDKAPTVAKNEKPAADGMAHVAEGEEPLPFD